MRKKIEKEIEKKEWVKKKIENQAALRLECNEQILYLVVQHRCV